MGVDSPGTTLSYTAIAKTTLRRSHGCSCWIQSGLGTIKELQGLFHLFGLCVLMFVMSLASIQQPQKETYPLWPFGPSFSSNGWHSRGILRYPNCMLFIVQELCKPSAQIWEPPFYGHGRKDLCSMVDIIVTADTPNLRHLLEQRSLSIFESFKPSPMRQAWLDL